MSGATAHQPDVARPRMAVDDQIAVGTVLILANFRGDERGTVFMFSTSQFISILLAPLAIGMLVYLSRAVTPEPKRARKAA